MFTDERRQKILEILERDGSIFVNDLVKTFNVTSATIRKDLNILAQSDLLIRTHGGAIKNTEKIINESEKAYDIRKSVNIQNKRIIAKKALKFITPNDCILLDASSTCYELAHLLSNYSNPLTVLTSGLRTANLLKENTNLTVVVIGGVVTANSNAIEGILGIDLLKHFNVNTFFTSSYAISNHDGLSDFKMHETVLKRQMIQRAARTIALLDYSKFEKKSIINFASLDDISLIISDDNLSDEIKNTYSNIQII